MQNVSNDYKQAMKLPIRNRATMMIAIGDVNPKLQTECVGNSTYTRYGAYFVRPFFESNNIMFQGGTSETYSTLEQDFTPTDGSMMFPPEYEDADMAFDTGYVSDSVIAENDGEQVQFVLGTEVELPLTVTLEISGGLECSGAWIAIYNGTNRVIEWATFDGNKATMTFNELPTASGDDVPYRLHFWIYANNTPDYRRLRIKTITFGSGLLLTENMIENAQTKAYCSRINESLPTNDFTAELLNYDSRYDGDNPDNPLAILDNENQEINAYFGYDVHNNGQYEWVHGGKFISSEWESGKYRATITGVDTMRNNELLYKHLNSDIANTPNAEFVLWSVMSAMSNLPLMNGLGNIPFEYDEDLKDIVISLPYVQTLNCKEVLQQLANYCCKTLQLDSEGRIIITGRDTTAEMTTLATDSVQIDELEFSETYTGALEQPFDEVVAKIHYVSDKDEVSQRTDCIFYRSATVSGSNYTYVFTDSELPIPLLRSYPYGKYDIEIVGIVHDETPNFDVTSDDIMNDIKTDKEEMIKEIVVPYYSVVNQTMDKTEIREDVVVVPEQDEAYHYECDLGGTFYSGLTFEAYNLSENIFDTESVPWVQGTLNANGSTASSTVRLRTEMYIPALSEGTYALEIADGYKIVDFFEFNSGSYTSLVKRTQINDTKAKVKLSSNSNYVKVVIAKSDDTTITTADLTNAKPYLGFVITSAENESSDYYISPNALSEGTWNVAVFATGTLNFVSADVVYPINPTGKSLRWDNPIVGDKARAQLVAEFVGDYLKSNVSYNYEYRGNPEVEVNDVITQDNDFVPDMETIISEHTINFNGAFKGEITARKKI